MERTQLDKYTCFMSTGDGKCDVEILKGIGIIKHNFQKLSKTGTNKIILNWSVIAILLYDGECMKISSRMK